MLRDRIADDLKSAMKAQDRMRLAALRLVNAAIKDRDIANRGKSKPPADDDELQGLLARMIKQREESARMYDEGGRSELAVGERSEIAVIREFLPRQLDEAEIKKAVDEAIVKNAANGLRDIGKVMGWLKEHYSGQMDFSKASASVREKLR